jgi:hypothetical protein
MTSAVSFIAYYSEFLTLQSTNEKFVLEDAQCFNSISEPSSEIRKTSFILFWHCNRPTKNSLYPCMHWAIESMGIGIIYVHRPVLEQKLSNNYCKYLQFQNWAAVIAAILYQSICLNFNHYCCSLYHWPLFYCI